MKNPFTRIRDYFSPPKLRNKPGGLAWIKSYGDWGSESIAGRIVKTVAVDSRGFWIVEPRPTYVFTKNIHFEKTGVTGWRGQLAEVFSIADRLLIPIEAPGDDAQDESLRYLPPVPTPTRTPETV